MSVEISSWYLCHTPKCTTNHILNCCPTSLSQGRYTWRHDSVLLQLFKLFRSNLDSNIQIYADLDNLRASESPPSTVPLDILVTAARPDIVIVDHRIIQLIELTIPANNCTSLENEDQGNTKISLSPVISNLGKSLLILTLLKLEPWAITIHPQLMQSITSFHTCWKPRKQLSTMLSTTLILCSYAIFNSRHFQDWVSPTVTPLTV